MAKSVKDMVRQYERNRYAFSEFLGLAEQDDVLKSLKEFPGVPYTFYGGVDGAERGVRTVHAGTSLRERPDAGTREL